MLTVLILTYNEESNLPFALESLKDLHAEVWIIDSGSTDLTLEIATQAGCHILHNQFTNHANQLNWAIANVKPRHPWVMRLDADERVTPELRNKIRMTLPNCPPDIVGIEVNRKIHFWGKWIRHGGLYPNWTLRLWRHGSGHCEERWMDEHMLVTGGNVVRLAADVIDENRKGMGFFIDKHNRYADREVKDLLELERRVTARYPHGQAGRKRLIKERYYARSPLFLRALAYWIYRYFLRGGVLDGRAGFVFHFMQGLWYRMLVDAKMVERRSNQRPKSTT